MATRTTTAVVRADVVGSLLRPAYLLEAREAALAGTIDADALRAAEDRAVLEAIALQEAAGIEAITDGEYRRHGWIALIPIIDDPLFRAPVSGFEFLDADSGWRDLWKTGAGEPADTSGLPPEEPFVTRRLEVDRDIVTDEFAFLKANAHARPKYTIPAPSWHRIYWHPEHSSDAYPTSDDFIADVTRILREHVVDRLVELGCDYVQIDAPNYAQWHIDPANRAAFEAHGHDMAQELVADAEFDSMVFEGLTGVTRAMHMCRGNAPGGMWAASGGYEAISKEVFPRLAEPRPAPARVRLGPRRHLRAARGRPPEPSGRARARDDEGRHARGSGRPRRAHRGGNALRAARAAGREPAVRVRVRRDRRDDPRRAGGEAAARRGRRPTGLGVARQRARWRSTTNASSLNQSAPCLCRTSCVTSR